MFRRRLRGCVAAAGMLACFAGSVRADDDDVVNSYGFEFPFVPGSLQGQVNPAGEGQLVSPGTWMRAPSAGASTAVVQSSVVAPGGGTQTVEVNRVGNDDARWGVPVDHLGFPNYPVPVPPEPAQHLISISWDMRVDQTAGSVPFGPYFAVEAYEDSVTTFGLLGSLGVDGATGEVLYQAPGTGFLTPAGRDVQFGTWNRFAIELDYSTDQYRIFVNAAPLGTFGFVDPGLDRFSDADIAALAADADPASQAASGTAYFDNFLVREGPATATPITRYWDTNGPTAGAGGPSPSGTWDGLTPRFNTDSTGGAGGMLSAGVGPTDTVIFAAGSDATGSYTVTLTGLRTAEQVSFEEGDVTLTGGTLATGILSASAGVQGIIESPVTGGPTGSVLKQGPGTVTLKANNTYTGGTTVAAGTLEVTRLHENNNVTITGPGSILRVLHSDPAGLGTHPERGDNAFVSRPAVLFISDGGTLDLTNNDMIVDYANVESPREALESLVASGYNGGDWLGDGITSSTAAVDGNYVLAIADNAALAAPFGTAQGGPLFSGVDVSLTAVLIKFTHRVDINLDGVITPDDASIFGTNYDESITSGFTFAMGDVDYDGACTPNDASIFGTFYDESLASLPEPASAVVLAVAVSGAIRRRRKGCSWPDLRPN